MTETSTNAEVENRRLAEREHDQFEEYAKQVNEATIQSGQLALRMSMLINGGAAVSVLAFIGTIVSKVGADAVPNVASTILWFACGVAAAVVGMALAYCTNYAHVTVARSYDKSYEHPYMVDTPSTARWTKLANIAHVGAFIVGLTSIVFFVIGLFAVRHAIAHLPPPPEQKATVYCAPAP